MTTNTTPSYKIAMQVYQTQRNVDMTEGRGPMVNDQCFLTYEDARTYINAQLGVMGSKPPNGDWTTNPYAEWQIATVPVLVSLSVIPAVSTQCAWSWSVRDQAFDTTCDNQFDSVTGRHCPGCGRVIEHRGEIPVEFLYRKGV